MLDRNLICWEVQKAMARIPKSELEPLKREVSIERLTPTSRVS